MCDMKVGKTATTILAFASIVLVLSVEPAAAQSDVGDAWGLAFEKIAGGLDPLMPDPSIAHDPAAAAYAITSAGHDIGDSEDGCAFAYAPFQDSLSVVVRVDQAFTGSATSDWSKAGIMIRESPSPGSPFVAYCTTRAEGAAVLQWRETAGQPAGWPGTADAPNGDLTYPYYLRLDREGGTFTGYYSSDGLNWQRGAAHTNVAFSNEVVVGMVVTSHEETNSTTMAFSEFRIGWYPPPTILVETFDDGSADGFVEVRGTWSLDGDAYTQSTEAPPGPYYSWVDAGDYTDYMVEVDFVLPGGGTAQVVYAHADTGTNYRVDFAANEVRVCVPVWGEDWFSRSFTTNVENLVTGQIYHARIDVGSEGVRVWLDYTLLLAESWAGGTPLGDGNVGVGTYGCSSSFDDFIVGLRERTSRVVVEDATGSNLVLRALLPEMNLLRVEATDSNLYSVIIDPGSGDPAVGLPDVPVFGNWILVPNGTTITTNVIPGDPIVYENIDLVAVQPPGMDIEGAPIIEYQSNDAIYGMDADYPGDFVSLTDVQTIRGQQCAIVWLNPYQYNPRSKTLRVYPELQATLIFNGSPEPVPQRLNSDSFNKMMDGLALNADPVRDAQGGPKGKPSLGGYGWDYLIFTHPKFAAPANKFAKWKKKLGFKPLVTQIPKGWKASDIQAAIAKASSTWEVTPSYVLLFGDAEYIPTHYKTYHPAQFLGNYKEGYTGTDLYYVTLNTNTYVPDIHIGRLSVDSEYEADDRVDGIINYEKGPYASTSFYSTATVCAYFEDPSIYYIYNPNTYKTSPTNIVPNGTAKKRFAQTAEDVAVFLSDPQHKINKTIKRMYKTDANVTPTHWNDGKQKHVKQKVFSGPAGDPGDPIPPYLERPGFGWNSDASDITDAVQEGTFFLLQRDHGNRQRWSHPYYNWSNAFLVNNPSNQPVILSISCRTGWFDNETDFPYFPHLKTYTEPHEESLAEYWERPAYSPYGDCGAVGIVAASRISFSYFNDHFVGGMMDAIWPHYLPKYSPTAVGLGVGSLNANPILEMGAVLDYGKYYMFKTCQDTNNHKRTQFEVYHWFGDPSMEIRVEEPRWLRAVVATSWPSAFIPKNLPIHVKMTSEDGLIDKGALEKATVTVTHPDSPSEFWTATTDAEGNVVFTGLTARTIGEYEVTVTASGFIYDEQAFTCSPGSAGGVIMDAEMYSGMSSVVIKIADIDLAGLGAQDVNVSTTSGDSEVFVLTEAPPGSGIFSETVPVEWAGLPPVVTPEDRILQLDDRDTITALYNDSDDGGGNPTSVVATATADCVAPGFGGLVMAVADKGALWLEWAPATDDHPGITYNIYRDQSPGHPVGERIGSTWGLSFPDYDARFGEGYYYVVRAEDAVGNEDTNMVERCVTNRFEFGAVGSGQTSNGIPEFTWSTRAADFYRIRSCSNLLSPQWVIEETVVSGGDLTTWQPTNTDGGPRFYSLEITDGYDE